MSTPDPQRWGSYNEAQVGRRVRPLATEAACLAGPGAGRVAVELGCGAGIEAGFLAEQGWRVHTFDADPSVVPILDGLAQRLPIAHVCTPLEELAALPECDLLLACTSLPFVSAPAFPRLWQLIRASLRPGGVLAVDLFGDEDDWAQGPGTFLNRRQVDALLEGFAVHCVVEEERDGRAFSGPKHWHTFRVLAVAN